MSYVLVRMYSGKSAHSNNELAQIAGKELASQLLKAGCQRYTTVVFSNGTVGSTSLYIDKAAADRGMQIAAEWARGGAMQGFQLRRTLRGEHLFGFHSPDNASLAGGFGAMRIYQSTASTADVKHALEHEALPILQSTPGLLRYTAFRTDEGDRFVALTANKTSESAREVSRLAREAVAKSGSLLGKVFPQPPEVIEGELINSFTA